MGLELGNLSLDAGDYRVEIKWSRAQPGGPLGGTEGSSLFLFSFFMLFLIRAMMPRIETDRQTVHCATYSRFVLYVPGTNVEPLLSYSCGCIGEALDMRSGRIHDLNISKNSPVCPLSVSTIKNHFHMNKTPIYRVSVNKKLCADTCVCKYIIACRYMYL